jgi:hypothetical protein
VCQAEVQRGLTVSAKTMNESAVRPGHPCFVAGEMLAVNSKGQKQHRVSRGYHWVSRKLEEEGTCRRAWHGPSAAARLRTTQFPT